VPQRGIDPPEMADVDQGDSGEPPRQCAFAIASLNRSSKTVRLGRPVKASFCGIASSVRRLHRRGSGNRRLHVGRTVCASTSGVSID
jgi:hypothetical protein